MGNRNLTLLTDLYELTMMQGYFKSNSNETVVFDLFYRKNPSDSGYAIACGLEQAIEYIKSLNFSYEDIEYLRNTNIFDEDFLTYLSSFHFSGDIYAIPEGSVVFPKEPLVKVIAPIMEAQLIETALLNIVNHQSLIATKASRVAFAAQGDDILEFGLRRAQGPDAGIYGARAAQAVASGKCDRGILICGTGIGMSLVANKVKGIRCALCSEPFSAKMTRLHNDANMLAMGAGIVGPNMANEIVDTFLDTDYSKEERHSKRIALIEG